MPYEPFHRLFATPVLPFGDDGTIDEPGYRAFLRRFLTPAALDAGLALVANPEAGELFTLDREERQLVVRMALEETAGRAPVLAGVVDVTTTGAVQIARDAAELGVDGLFVFPPIGAGDITQSWDAEAYPEVLVDLLHAITDAVDLPIVVHPVGRTTPAYGVGLPPAAVRRICEEVPQVVGWKMTYNYDGYRAVTRTLRELDRPVAILGAVGKYFHENLANDAFEGTATGTFNYALEPMLDHIQAWRQGDVRRATEIWNSGLSELQEYVFSDFGRLHVRYKTAAWLRGLIGSPLMRPPMPRPRRQEVDRLAELLRGCRLDVIDKDVIDSTARRLTLAE
ncbi:dihydrodipicolinate synthase family protein [Pseudonocardia cypriaca]|uniref:Dihydrodipicolinate synthase/N-acetylneuraminate lyase n=1 Tax=Pseudonocardia cypriaca TaxID=882449 RepID=A0A543FSV1_9PSEU|nr:dihydrodipicolinate synthase family protein [Pseudonocardia cypriaca]TQM36834.1 dihydrodipicolinate synthase/N-acetylneuraminate lyase [Pseudonocardia cypriaca]